MTGQDSRLSNIEREVRRATLDPGQFVKRERTKSDYGGYDYEPLHAWQARAVVAALPDYQGAVDDRNWLAGLVYEFLLIGPRQRTQLNEAEMKRFLAIPRGGQ